MSFINGEKEILEDFDWKVGLQPLVFLILSFPVYTILHFLFELKFKKLLRRRERNVILPPYNYQYEKDTDVTKEEQKIQEEGAGDSAVCADGLSKAYPSKIKGQPRFLAAYNVSFSVNKGEVFALLGVNGAGKTTTFNMLTNNLQPNKGTVYIYGQNIESPQMVGTNIIGYCPQTNILFDNLTVKEHFSLYAAIKGIPHQFRMNAINFVVESLGIAEYMNKSAGKLSGGTKRKLSVALAILGNPSVVLLDEPSTGIDPQARRQMWNIIGDVSHKWKKCGVILTTHSMEEAEALSTRLAIMVNGTLRCIGPAQYIKNKYAIGFCVEVKFKTPMDDYLISFAKSLKIEEDLNQTIDYQRFYEMIVKIGLNEFANSISSSGDHSDLCYMISAQGGILLMIGLRYIAIEYAKKTLSNAIAAKCGYDVICHSHYIAHP